ncbi:DUF881 domain-containing protein [Sporosalibacterium faouarense]|uniref:DUF881 domain-containing protein n=1 Tax=Sporosalibacterium faouarense TaxID=516123 RepID=UPI00141C79E5|nr:DUF881 domain-containing protein [Sporosalibacterium faouarense]MTI49038.1 DUF881 domain-containing protein [Bacillota bacterium]
MKTKLSYKIIIFVMAILLGVLLSSQMKQDLEGYSQVSLKSVQMVKNEIENYKSQISDLNKMIEKKEEEVNMYENTLNDNGNISDVLKEEIEHMKFLAGYKDVQGPGIILTISDSVKEINYGENINQFLVHDMDVQRLVNDLKIAGAEAISVSGQRVLSSSEIECNGPTIKINDRTYAIPFVIKAIGDPKVLNAAINAPGTYGYQLKEVYELELNTTVSDFLLIPKYKEDIDFEFVKPLEEGE